MVMKKEEISEVQNAKASPKECKFNVGRPVQVQYVDAYGDKKGMLKNQDTKCTHVADGLNGFCLDHSYVVIAPVAKSVNEIITQNVKIGNNIKEVTDEVESIKIFNVGEPLPASKFSKQEINDHFLAGNLAVRTQQNEHKMYNKLASLDDAAIDGIVAHPPHEIEMYLSRGELNKETLEKFLFKVTSESTKDVIRKKIGDLDSILR
jgi:hypothetical protein